ncbi:MAG: GGDEF domain-containing protein [Arenimonas sp.]
MSHRRRQADTQQIVLQPDPLPSFEESFLVVIDGPRLGRCVRLQGVPLVIGRAPNAGFCIEHPSVSRLHCAVQPEVLGASVRDLDSKNGTRVNGARVRGAELHDGDHLMVGEVLLKFVAGGGAEARYHEALYGLANLDSLTQLHNRRAFRELLDHAVAKAGEQPLPPAVAIIDLDFFKQVNDRLGHDAGDSVLRRLSAILRRQLRPGDMAGRLGGDEFAVLLGPIDADEAAQWCEQLRVAIRDQGLQDADMAQPLSISIGLARWDPAMGEAHELLRLADMALLQAKAAGRNCVRTAKMDQ